MKSGCPVFSAAFSDLLKVFHLHVYHAPPLLRSLHVLLALASATVCLAAISPWWSSRNVVKKDATGQPLPAQDYAVINQGQLKNFARAAVEEMNANGLPGGAGTILDSLIASWATPDANTKDYAAANLG